MAGGVGHHGGAVRQGGVQVRGGGVPALFQVVLVIAKADDPLPGGDVPLLPEIPHPLGDLPKVSAPGELAQPQGLGQGCDVAVAVHKSG